MILLIRDTGNGKQCFQIKGKEITKYKPKPKTQYVIGKAIPIGRLDGGARLNAYLVRYGVFRFKLSKVPQLSEIIRKSGPHYNEVDALLSDVIWHIFVDDKEVYTGYARTIYGGDVLSMYVSRYYDFDSFFKLDESKSSVDLSSDMYIYLIYVSDRRSQNFTSKTLFYVNDVRIWKPAFESPLICSDNCLANSHNGYIQLQKLHTRQKRSKRSGSRINFTVRKYRGNIDSASIKRYGVYRYRLVRNCKKVNGVQLV